MTLDHLPPELTRTHRCGELRTNNDGARVVAMGWVARRRDLGSLIFIDLRDRTGLLQVVFNEETQPQVHARAEELRSEYVVAVEGTIIRRKPETVNASIATGEVELVAERLLILNDARTPPFPLDEDASVAEDTRLRFRFVDLRRQRMQSNIELRHRVNQETRRVMTEQGFLEIETPVLTRSTPEGARDYLVPSRVQQGSFYALPQSPQLFKQLLMISGFDRYFQIVRCFRDEDLRADRQPEFTQLDVEMSFPQFETIFEVIERLMERLWAVSGYKLARPFPRMSYDEALARYGTDKPDLRLPPMHSVRDFFTEADRQKLGIDSTLPFVAFVVPGCGGLSRKERDEFRQFGAERGLKVFDDLRGIEKHYPAAAQSIRGAVTPKEADLVLLAGAPAGEAGPATDPAAVRIRSAVILTAAGALRLFAGQKYASRHGLLKPDDFRFLWVLDFPMLEWDEQEKRYAAMHHPFTSPTDETLEKLESDPGAVRAKAYDIVLNGTEIGGGSIRIHRKDVQSRVFRALGMSEEQARQRFGFFLDALEYGTPPHGGIALGLDRIVAIMAMEASIREVIAFPKTARAVDLMCEAPTPVSPAQLKELGLQLRKDLS
ncbi:MAG: aspartate--tRNA ligase [Acidobacteria bacterium RIFCSPLOWO2_02_FULL_60_20]|nr:MAG: aspartate--tRNA ligase [Acidobacteria bacterium RIFCSPLOWO2_02_FULL_60_20]